MTDLSKEEQAQELKPCPCGAVPTDLSIIDNGQGGKWASATGNCCGEWSIEFRTKFAALDSDKCKELARKAWNLAPRAQQQPAQPSEPACPIDGWVDGEGDPYCQHGWGNKPPEGWTEDGEPYAVIKQSDHLAARAADQATIAELRSKLETKSGDPELERLRAINAELVEALDGLMICSIDLLDEDQVVAAQKAKHTLAKARSQA